MAEPAVVRVERVVDPERARLLRQLADHPHLALEVAGFTLLLRSRVQPTESPLGSDSHAVEAAEAVDPDASGPGDPRAVPVAVSDDAVRVVADPARADALHGEAVYAEIGAGPVDADAPGGLDPAGAARGPHAGALGSRPGSVNADSLASRARPEDAERTPALDPLGRPRPEDAGRARAEHADRAAGALDPGVARAVEADRVGAAAVSVDAEEALEQTARALAAAALHPVAEGRAVDPLDHTTVRDPSAHVEDAGRCGGADADAPVRLHAHPLDRRPAGTGGGLDHQRSRVPGTQPVAAVGGDVRVAAERPGGAGRRGRRRGRAAGDGRDRERGTGEQRAAAEAGAHRVSSGRGVGVPAPDGHRSRVGRTAGCRARRRSWRSRSAAGGPVCTRRRAGR